MASSQSEGSYQPKHLHNEPLADNLFKLVEYPLADVSEVRIQALLASARRPKLPVLSITGTGVFPARACVLGDIAVLSGLTEAECRS